MRILRGLVNGKPRTIVVLGESHYKNQADSELGQKIISEFNHIGFGHGRNQTMIRNSIQVFEQNPDAEVLIDIVGANHVNGMARGFRKKYGFEEISVESIEIPKSPAQ